MDRFGLTKEEEKMNLHQYNHALFRNMMFFMDIVWEINMLTGTVVVLEDKNDPEENGKEYLYRDLFRKYMDNHIRVNEYSIFREYLSYENLKELKEGFSADLRIRSNEGAWNLHRLAITPAFDEGGQLYCVYMSARNLHTEEHREMAEYHSQEHFRNVLMADSYFHYTFDVSGDGLIQEDFLSANGKQLIQEITGMEFPVHYETFSQKWNELYDPRFDKDYDETIFTLDYLRDAFARGERLLDFEVKQKPPKDSEISDYMRQYIFLTKNPVDRHIYACVIWKDISAFHKEAIEDNKELKTFNEELRRSISQEEQFQQATLSGALLVYNINLTKNLIEDEFYEIVDGKKYAMLQLVGLKAPCDFDEFCEKWSKEKVPEDSKETFLKVFNRQYMLDAYERGERQLELEFDTVMGRGIRITLRSTALLVEDKVSGDLIAMVNSKDVSAQRKQEYRQREALREAYEAANHASSAKSDFLACMSHDMRTPMNAIIGMTAIARNHLDDRERIEDCLKKIAVSSKHLLGLINEVLDMSKIESGKVNFQEEEIVLPELLDNLVALSKAQAKEKDQTLDISFHGIEHEKALGDSQRIEQAFMNVMNNAIKYTPSGGRIQLTITEKPINKPDVGCYEFIIEDNGIGMSKEFTERLFDAFARAEDRRIEKIQGAGLGLAIAKNIVQMMNGTIEVESELNKGTKFTIIIFLKLQNEAEDAFYAKLVDLPVLVIDDDELACETTCETLKELGMKGEWVLSGEEALELIAKRHEAKDDYYAVIVDWRMPVKDGVTVTKEIRQQFGDSLPIIIFSAYDWSDIEQEARAAGATAFLGKPLFKSRMARVFKELMGYAETEQKSAMETLAEQDYSGRRILLVEDNDLNAEIAEEILKMVGLVTERAENGKEAVDMMAAAEDDYYDMVFMDIQMPVMNGFEATRGIRALKREYAKRVPILAMSANAFAEDIQNALNSGMNEHLAKPLDFQKLQNALKKWLK